MPPRLPPDLQRIYSALTEVEVKSELHGKKGVKRSLSGGAADNFAHVESVGHQKSGNKVFANDVIFFLYLIIQGPKAHVQTQ